MARIFRLYAYLYHLILALYLLGISTVAYMSHNTLKLSFLPWSGQSLFPWLFGGAIIGIISIILAVTGIFRYLFPFWAFVVLVMLLRGFLIQPYSFESRDEFTHIMWITAGALLAFLASVTLFFIRRRESSPRVR